MSKTIPESDVILHASIAEWKRFLAKDENPDGIHIFENIFSNGLLMPLQRKNELRKMLELAATVNPKIVMEVGSDKGGSFYHWVKAFRPEKAIAIEIRGVPFAETFPAAFPYTKFLCLPESSYTLGSIARVKGFLGEDLIDCLFIDGDKCAFDKDVAAYLPMMRKGGLMFLHDVQDVPNAQETMAKYSKTHRTQTIYDVSEFDAIEARMKSGLPPADCYEDWFRVWKRTSCAVGVIFA